MDKQQIIDRLCKNIKISFDKMSDREICSYVIDQCVLVDKLQELYKCELNKYESKYMDDAFEAMRELNLVFEPYIKRNKSQCFFPDRSTIDQYDFSAIVFPGVSIIFHNVISYEEVKEEIKSMFPNSLKSKYDIEYSISDFYNTKNLTIFKLSVKLIYKI